MQFARLLTLVTIAVTVSAAPFGADHATVIKRGEVASEYDYIVVGGGTAGLTIANRLSENPKIKVLVIEAGIVLNGEDELPVLNPNASFGLANDARIWWNNLQGSPIEGLNNRESPVQQPKVAGGGSAINGMTFDRGSARDYDDWGAYIGDSSWSWRGLLPYFKKAETFTPPSPEQVAEFGITWDWSAHGRSGPIDSTFPPYIAPSAKTFHDAEAAFGIPSPRDPGAGTAVGSLWVPNNIRPGEYVRSYAKNEHHDVAKKRRNYEILAETTVTKVNIKKDWLRRLTATGVDYTAAQGEPVKTVRAKREVIVTAGGVQSSKLLQISGIGDSRVLQQHNIPVLVDLPGVGQNLQDHGGAGLFIFQNLPEDPPVDPELARTVSTGNHLSFYSLPMIAPDNYQAIVDAAEQDTNTYLPADTHSSVARGFKVQKQLLLSGFRTNSTAVSENVRQLVSVQRPLSRGNVAITGPTVWDPLVLNWRTLSHPFDVTVMVEGAKMIRRLFEPQYWPEGTNPVEFFPGANVTTDAQLTEWARSSMTPTFYHLSGSAHMGKRENGGVVDRKLKVYGVKGLRVADSSIIPLIPATHICNTVFAIAEKAADLIKADQWLFF